jgi:hypothetical protein
MKKYFFLLALFIFGSAFAASAQNMSGTVTTKEIKFAKGKHEASVPGSARYGRSYVYTLGAKAGQTMDVSVSAKNRELTFSVIGPDDETLEGAFGVTEWSGTLPANGKYQVVVVMNDENVGTVPFTLKAKIR